MSRPAAATGSGGTKRPAEVPTTAMDAAAIQRPRLGSAGAATAPVVAAASPSSSLSSAQKCAADTLGAVFSFLPFAELPAALRVCRPWLAAGNKGKAREERISRAERLAALCVSRSPLCRHIRQVSLGMPGTVSLTQLSGLAALPSLATLSAGLDAAELKQLLDQHGAEQALVELRAAFPPRLRELTLVVSPSHSAVVCQLVLDALPAMGALELLRLVSTGTGDFPAGVSSLSLQPLLQLPNLTSLDWLIGELSVTQLQTVKQIPLREFDSLMCRWSAEQLSALCRPPHRLQRLKHLDLTDTDVGAGEMVELVHLSGLKLICPFTLSPGAFSFLRFPLLEELSLNLDNDFSDDLSDEQHADIDASLRACASLTHLSLNYGVLTEELGARLARCVPRLRRLDLIDLDAPSLHFLRLAPNLVHLGLRCCEVRPTHLMLLTWWAPGLQRLFVRFCRGGLRLDEFELQLLTPPSTALPQLQQFNYVELEGVD